MANETVLDPTTQEYLATLCARCRNLLGNRLTGLYVHGSAAQGDYLPGKSDLDVLGVITGPWPEEAKRVLAQKIGHASLPVPAPGLDFILVTADAAANPVQRPAYELWFSTGATWPTAIEVEGSSSEMLVHFAACRESGQVLVGAVPGDVFGPIEYGAMLQALIDILEWYQGKVLDSFHDPLGQHSVLNACRARRYAEERTLSSKRGGAEWLLSREPEQKLARRALAIRRGEVHEPLDAPAVRDLLSEVIEVCHARMRSVAPS